MSPAIRKTDRPRHPGVPGPEDQNQASGDAPTTRSHTARASHDWQFGQNPSPTLVPASQAFPIAPVGNPPMSTLTVICGPMFAGKTTALLRHIHSARESGESVLVVKPERDTRYDPNALVTHTGERIRAHNAHTARDILPLVDAAIDRPSLVAIDEIHFFASEAVGAIETLLSRGIAVVVAGCDIDHFGELFTPFDALLPRADSIERKYGTCARCGAPSTHSERRVAATERIIVGGAGEFIATCASCFRASHRGMS